VIVLGQAVCALFSTQMPYNGISTIGQFCLRLFVWHIIIKCPLTHSVCLPLSWE